MTRSVVLPTREYLILNAVAATCGTCNTFLGYAPDTGELAHATAGPCCHDPREFDADSADPCTNTHTGCTTPDPVPCGHTRCAGAIAKVPARGENEADTVWEIGIATPLVSCVDGLEHCCGCCLPPEYEAPEDWDPTDLVYAD